MVRKPATDLESEAAQWFVRWSDTSEAAGAREQSRWIAWLQRSPKHVAAYFAVDDMCSRVSESAALNDFDVDAWMANRRAKVSSLPATPARRIKSPEDVVRRPLWLHWSAAAAVAAIALGALTLWQLSSGRNSYRTGVGEQKTVHLADGSVLQLNTRSQARVSYTDGAREIQLKGEALFTVAKDLRRPFLVRTHDATVRALGTRFNVYEQGTATRVAVLEGKVRVSSSSRDQSFDLAAGEGAEVTKSMTHKQARANVKAATAWQNSTLVFERARLADVALEFNRYNAMQFRVDAATGETNRLSGTFDSRHPESLLLWLQSRQDLAVNRQGDVYLVQAVKNP